VIKNSVRRKEKRAAAKWLQSLIGEDWGIRVLPADADSPRPVHANTNKRFEAVISRALWKDTTTESSGLDEMIDVPWESPNGSQRRSGIWLQRLSQKLILRHFEGVPCEFRINGEIITKPETVYFTGNRTKPDEICLTLLMIDIDSHKKGSLEEAMRFAGHLRAKCFPGCYIEVSTNGNGAHIFFVVDKTDWADVDYNAALKAFDAWLKGVLAETGIELDCVEVKGNCATVSWVDGVPKHKMGTLAKLPREWERFEELRSSPVYSAHQLLAFSRAHPITEKHAPAVQRIRQEGSIPFCGVDPRRIERWMEVAKRLVPAAVHVSTTNRVVVTHEDVGIFCALLEYVGKSPNEDGTLPWERTKKLWDCLRERGVISRAFNAKRFAWIRRMLNGAGLVDIQDATYVIGERAAKWSPSEKFWSVAASIDSNKEEGEQYFTETGLVGNVQDWWEKGIPLLLIGISTKETAERRRMEELIEAIICPSGWNLAA
jgi:hypothetical protein